MRFSWSFLLRLSGPSGCSLRPEFNIALRSEDTGAETFAASSADRTDVR